jgi:hypothetical protein
MLERTKQVFTELLERLISGAVNVLPGLVAIITILVVSTLIARVGSSLVRRGLLRFDFDRRLREWGLTPAGPAGSGTVWAARISFWLVMLLGVLVSLSVFDTPATRSLIQRVSDFIPTLLFASFIFLAGAASAAYLERSVLISAVNMGMHSARLVALGVRWLVLVFGTAMALAHLGVGGGIVTTAFAILFGGIVLALALAVGLGARDMVGRSLEKLFTAPPELKDATPAPPKISHL